MTASPQSTQKSERHEKQIPLSTPSVERKFERIEKQNTESSPRSFDRVKKSILSNSLGSKQSGKGLSLSDLKWKEKNKRKSLIHVTMESGRAEPDPESIGVKRMKMDARSYKAIFKKNRMMDTFPGKLNHHLLRASSANQQVQFEKAESDPESIGVKRKKMNAGSNKAIFKKKRILETLPDVDEELEGPDILSQVGSGDGRVISSAPTGKKEGAGDESCGRMVEKMRVKRVDGASDEAPERCISSLRGSDVGTFGNDINAEPIYGHIVEDRSLEPSDCDGSEKSGIGYTVRESLDDAGRVLTNCSSTSNMEVPESVILTHLGRSLDGAIGVGNGEQHIYPNAMRSTMDSGLDHTTMNAGKDVFSAVADPATSLHEPENDNRLGLHVECTEKRRTISIELDIDEPEERIAPSVEQRSLHIFLQREMTRLCQILKLPDGLTHMVRRFLKYVIANNHVSSESPTTLQAFQMALCWIAASIINHKIDKKDMLMLAKQILNYGCTEEQANSIYSKMQQWERMFLQCSETINDSSRNCLLATDDIGKESSNVDTGVSQFSSFKLKNVKSGVEEKSTTVEPDNCKILSQHKQAPKYKVSGSETKDKIKQIQEKCDKGLKKLVRQQWKEIQEFRRIWEEKRVQLENDYRLKTAFVRCIYDQGSMRINKLKLLDEDIAKKMEEHKFLKDMNLKDLEAKQLAAQKDEREKAEYLLVKAKACCSDIRSDDESHLLESQSEDPGHSQTIAHITVSGPENVISRSEQHIEELHNKIVCDLQWDDVVPCNTSVTVSAEAVGCTVPTETVNNSINIMPERKVGIVHCEKTSVVAAEQPKELNPLACGERVSDEIPSSEQIKKVMTEVPETVYTDIVGHSCSVKSHNAPIGVYDKLDTNDLPENVINQSVGADKLIDGVPSLLPLELEQTIASPDHCGSMPQSQVAQDKCHQCSVSAELQDKDAQGTKNQSTTPVEVAILEAVEAVTSVQSNHEVIENCEQLQPHSAYVSPGCNQVPAGVVERQIQDEARSTSPIAEASLHLTKELEALSYQASSQSGGNLDLHPPVVHIDSTLDEAILETVDAVISVQSNHEVIENCQQLQQISSHVSPGCDQISASEVEHQTQDEARCSSQTAEASLHLTEDLEELSYQANSQSGGNLELHPPVSHVVSTLDGNHLDLGSANGIDIEPSGELNASSEINVTMSRAVTCTIELPNQAVLQLREDVTHLQGPSNLLDYPSDPVGSWNPTPSFHAKPLQDELHRLRKEIEQEIKVHEDKKSQLKSDCKKEIHEIIAQIRDKYDTKLKDAEAAYWLMKNELANNYNKVIMNKILAEAFKSKCFSLRPSEHPGTQQAVPSSHMQHLHQLSLPTSVRLSRGFSSRRPAYGYHTTAPNVQPVQPTVSHSTRPSHVAVLSSSQPVQPLQHAAALSHNVPTRPPHVGTLTPSTGNLRVCREIHSLAPHPQAFRPAASTSVASVASFPPSASSQLASVLRPAASSSFSQEAPPPPQHQPLLHSHPQTPQPVTTNFISHGHGLPAPPSISQSTQELHMDMDTRPRVQLPHSFSPIPLIRTTFDLSQQSELQSFGNMQGGLTSSVVQRNVVYLSDDD
ncbi:putative helicase protein MOM1 [Abeliophyllum distichum]|uniref:Helicase protein MOM1 n=1 Tax=Abeliophyllum distichum TaxID=126358 RepID=A0ABD1Q5B3_9LAMI